MRLRTGSYWGKATGLVLTVLGGVLGQDTIPKDVITTDVAILGGGVSGAYAAVRLREDYGKKVVVIEKQSRLVRRSKHTMPKPNHVYSPTKSM
jgi:heterodisulfide reductase subunit A-like polyferredoxin